MHPSRRLATALATIMFAAALAPVAAPSPARAVGECGTHRSETVPPPTVRVYRTATGAVEAVDFRTYAKNVLSREWISSWTTESLRSGALAVKHYAWYQVIHWRGYQTSAGECFDVFDSTRDQVYDPARPTYASMAAAVDATWDTLALRNGRIFATYYNAGGAYEACGANANGWQMFQWGTQACGLAGYGAAQIMATYYPGVTISAAPPAIPPPAPAPPTPAPTPAPEPTPPPTEAPAPVPAPPPPPSGEPAPAPTPAPTPAPATTPAPPPVAMPGGGQVGLSAPPTPPPPNPEPIVVSVVPPATGPSIAAVAAAKPQPMPAVVDIEQMSNHAVVRFERAVDAAGLASARAASAASPRLAMRLLVVRLLIQRALRGVPLAFHLEASPPAGARRSAR